MGQTISPIKQSKGVFEVPGRFLNQSAIRHEGKKEGNYLLVLTTWKTMLSVNLAAMSLNASRLKHVSCMIVRIAARAFWPLLVRVFIQ